MIDFKELDIYRKIGDPKADEFVKLYFSEKSQKIKFNEAFSQLKSNLDWDSFLKNIPEASWFDTECYNIPSPDIKITNSAIKFFQNKEAYILQLLGLLSLPYCYAAADGAQVLYQTERMYKDVAKRLEETAEFISSIMKLNAFETSGSGKVQIFKVRVMHAAARFYLQNAAWDNSLGVPINQEDMVGTNLSFSLIVIRGLRKMGFSVSYEEQMNYIQFWSWIGILLGVHQSLLPSSGKEAHDLDLMIKKRHFKSSIQGVVLTNSLLKCFYSLNDEKEISNKEIAGFMRFLIGNDVADLLEIPKANFQLSKRILLKLKVSLI